MEKNEEKEHLFSKNLSNFTTSQLMELYHGINQSFMVIDKNLALSFHWNHNEKELVCIFYFISVRFNDWLSFKFFEFFKPKVSFAAKIDKLKLNNAKLICEIKKWKFETISKLKRKQKAELEIDQLKIIVCRLHVKNEKSEEQVKKWKIIAKKFKMKVNKYYKAMKKIFAVLEKVRSQLPNVCIE